MGPAVTTSRPGALGQGETRRVSNSTPLIEVECCGFLTPGFGSCWSWCWSWCLTTLGFRLASDGVQPTGEGARALLRVSASQTKEVDLLGLRPGDCPAGAACHAGGEARTGQGRAGHVRTTGADAVGKDWLYGLAIPAGQDQTMRCQRKWGWDEWGLGLG